MIFSRVKRRRGFFLVLALPLLLGGCDRPDVGVVWLQATLLTLIGGGNLYMPSDLTDLCESDLQGFVNPVFGVEGYATIPFAHAVSLPDIAAGKYQRAPFSFGCFPCFKELVRDQYDYVESFYDAKDDPPYSEYGSRGMVTGLYRYTLEARNDQTANCAEFDDWVWRVWRAEASLAQGDYVSVSDLSQFGREYREYKSLLGNRCVVKKRIERLSAPYIYENRQDVIKPATWFLIGGDIVRYRRWVYERETKKPIAVHELFAFAVKTRGGSLENFTACSSERLPPINTILQPRED
ncbi:hypothetical protein [Tepidicaulis sp.]|uniref:hypothetical protein n=1 Tax=Tepidicaulis sp. TaxID=1920809 RepID=UPI003B5C8EA3